MRVGNALAKQLRDVNVGEREHQHRNHEGDGEHDFGSSAHASMTNDVGAQTLVRPDQNARNCCRDGRNHSSLPEETASAAAAPYSLSLLCRVFRLIPRISAARVLLLFVASSVFRISSLSASSTVVPTPSRTASGSSAEVRTGACPNPGGRCLVSTIAPSQTITARSRVLRNSRTFPGHE